MQFKVVPNDCNLPTPEPVVELNIYLADGLAYLRARKAGCRAWIYLLELGDSTGVRLFHTVGGSGLPYGDGGALKINSGYACTGGLPG